MESVALKPYVFLFMLEIQFNNEERKFCNFSNNTYWNFKLIVLSVRTGESFLPKAATNKFDVGQKYLNDSYTITELSSVSNTLTLAISWLYW